MLIGTVVAVRLLIGRSLVETRRGSRIIRIAGLEPVVRVEVFALEDFGNRSQSFVWANSLGIYVPRSSYRDDEESRT